MADILSFIGLRNFLKTKLTPKAPDKIDGPEFRAYEGEVVNTMEFYYNKLDQKINTTGAGESSKGGWNAATNTPTLGTLPSQIGDYYDVTVPGTQSITGSSVAFGVGDRIKSDGSAWYRIPASNVPGDGTVSRTKLDTDVSAAIGRQENFAAVNGKPVIYSVIDANDQVIFVLYADGTTSVDTNLSLGISNGLSLTKVGNTYVLNNGTTEGLMPFGDGSVKAIASGFIGTKEILHALVDGNDNVVVAYFKDGTSTLDANMSVGVSNGLSVSRVGNKFVFNYGTTEGQVPFGDANVQILSTGFLNAKQILYGIADANGDVLFALFADGSSTLTDNRVTPLAAEIAIARGVKLVLNDRIKQLITDRGLPTTPLWGTERLRRWSAWKRNPDSAFDVLVLGHSYVQGGYFTGSFRSLLLAEGYADGGAGYCGFSRWSDTLSVSINGSIDPSLLSVSYTLADWGLNAGGPGVEGYVTCKTINSSITVTSSVALASLTLIYERHAGAGSFQWRLNGGGWTSVSTANATQDIQSVVINTSGAGAGFTIDIQGLAAGVNLCGAIGRKSVANGLTVHKAGISGGNAAQFANVPAWSQAVNLLSPKLTCIILATNEQVGGIAPSVYKANVQTIITTLRGLDPMMDLLLIAPPFTQFETEQPSAYSMKDYASATLELANDNHCAFINLSRTFGDFSQALVDAQFMFTDRIHPGPRGGYLIADTVFKPFKK